MSTVCRGVSLFIVATMISTACASSTSAPQQEVAKPRVITAPSGTSSPSPKRLYATLPAEVHVFWRTVEKGIQKAAEDHGYQTLIRSAHDDQQFMEDKNLESDLTRFLVKNGARTIIIAPSQALDPTNEPPKAAFVFAGRGPDKFTLPYGEGTLVAVDSFQAGRKAALALKDVLPVGAKVGAFEINNRIVTIGERIAGFVSEARVLGFEVVFDDLPLGLGIREAEANARQVFASHPELQAVFTPNELTTLGATRALAGLPETQRPLLVGFDFRAEFAESIRNGSLLAVVVQDPFLIGYTCAETVIQLESGRPVPKGIEVETFLVDRMNLESQVIQERLKDYLN